MRFNTPPLGGGPVRVKRVQNESRALPWGLIPFIACIIGKFTIYCLRYVDSKSRKKGSFW
jgi:hypothetical protein